MFTSGNARKTIEECQSSVCFERNDRFLARGVADQKGPNAATLGGSPRKSCAALSIPYPLCTSYPSTFYMCLAALTRRKPYGPEWILGEEMRGRSAPKKHINQIKLARKFKKKEKKMRNQITFSNQSIPLFEKNRKKLFSK